MEPVQAFEHLVWKDHYEGDLSMMLKDARHLLDTSLALNVGLERDGGVSSSSDPDAPHNWISTGPFLNWVDPLSLKIWKHWGYPLTHERILSGSWVNRHPNGAWTDAHQHGMVPQVIVLYLDNPENGGNLEVAHPLFYHWSSTIKSPGYEWIEIPVKTGDVIIFPGWINHRTQKNQSSQDRIVMSINVGR
jgi:hypothetical protein